MPALERAPSFGATSFSLTRSEEDHLHFLQTTVWEIAGRLRSLLGVRRGRRGSRGADRPLQQAGLPGLAHVDRRRARLTGPTSYHWGRGRGPLLRDPVLRPAARGRGAVVPLRPRRGGSDRLRRARHPHEPAARHRQRRHQRRLEAGRRRPLRGDLRADPPAPGPRQPADLGAALLRRRLLLLLVPPLQPREPRSSGPATSSTTPAPTTTSRRRCGRPGCR